MILLEFLPHPQIYIKFMVILMIKKFFLVEKAIMKMKFEVFSKPIFPNVLIFFPQNKAFFEKRPHFLYFLVYKTRSM